MHFHPQSQILHSQLASRRALLQHAGMGLGSIALGCLLGQELRGETASVDPQAAKPPHFKPRAKNVIFLHMVGAVPA